MTADIAAALLNRAATGTQMLEILDTIVSDIEQENIDDFASYAAAISAQPTLSKVQF